MVTVSAGTRWVKPPLGVRPTPSAARGSSQLAAIAESFTVVLLSLIHISEPTRLGMISYAVFCLKKKTDRLRVWMFAFVLVLVWKNLSWF